MAHTRFSAVQKSFAEKKVTALIGPLGCGETTLLRCFNRLHDLYPKNWYVGEILLYPDGINIVSRQVYPIGMLMRISMVFQKPNPFPKWIFENVAYGLRLRGVRHMSTLQDMVEASTPCRGYLGGRARTACSNQRIAPPAVNSSACVLPAPWPSTRRFLLRDEPTSALDPGATARIEDLLHSRERPRHDHHRHP